MRNLNLVLVKEDRIKELAELTSEIWHEYWPVILTDEQIDYMVEIFQSEKAIINQINNENYEYYFLVSDDKIVGYTGISKKEEYLFLSKLYIKKEFRHHGFGYLAFEAIKNMGYNRIRLTVNKYNQNTINAYLKYGFKVIDSTVTDIGNGFVMDDYIMEWNLL